MLCPLAPLSERVCPLSILVCFQCRLLVVLVTLKVICTLAFPTSRLAFTWLRNISIPLPFSPLRPYS